MQFILEARDIIIKKGGREILGVDHFSLREGEIIAVIGPNGAGKSTLLQVLALLQRPASGQVLFRGSAVSKNNILGYRRKMAVVFQEALLLNTTVFNNVAQGLKLRGSGRKEIYSRVGLWLERLGVSHLAGRMPSFLSGGEAQRVNIARAMALDPEVLFLDEPFTAPAITTRISLLKEMGSILKDSRTTVFFVTHDYNEIPYLTDDTVVMAGGGVRRRGSAAQLFAGGFEKVFETYYL
ncbi:MAG: ATP-binding cassette domain-containing protein [Firmicutes bacterium]|nr:ATP-binding cassette domain-containing protein [Bacillota bacterium]